MAAAIPGDPYSKRSRWEPYHEAARFLGDASATGSMRKEQLEDLRWWVMELDPNTPAGKDCPRDRITTLEEKIRGVFATRRWEQIRAAGPDAVVQEKCRLLEDLGVDWCDDVAGRKDFYSRFEKRLSSFYPDVFTKFHEMVWISHGCPDEWDYAKKRLMSRSVELEQDLPCLLGGAVGTLFDQMVAEVYLEHQITTGADVSVAMQQKINLFKERARAPSVPRNYLQALFQRMPPTVKDFLRSEGYRPPGFNRDLLRDRFEVLSEITATGKGGCLLSSNYDAEAGVTCVRAGFLNNPEREAQYDYAVSGRINGVENAWQLTKILEADHYSIWEHNVVGDVSSPGCLHLALSPKPGGVAAVRAAPQQAAAWGEGGDW